MKKMLIKSSDKVESTHEVEIIFPVFRRYNSGGDSYESETWLRWDENGDEWKVHYSYSYGARTTAWEVEHDKVLQPGPPESLDYILGRGEYACTAEQFAAALQKAREFIAKI